MSLHEYGARFKEQKKISLHNERMRLVTERCRRPVCPYCYQPTCQCEGDQDADRRSED